MARVDIDSFDTSHNACAVVPVPSRQYVLMYRHNKVETAMITQKYMIF